jgi:hypothetical protein
MPILILLCISLLLFGGALFPSLIGTITGALGTLLLTIITTYAHDLQEVAKPYTQASA